MSMFHQGHDHVGGDAHGHGHDHGLHHHARRGELTRRAAYASIALAASLVGLKVWAAWATGSVAMLGSLADTMLDLLASVITLFGVWVAAMPADDDHKFGHGKAEALAALAQVALISASAAGIAWRAIERMDDTTPLQSLELGIGVSVIASVLTFALLAYQRWIIRRTNSVAIMADHVHYQSDLLLNGAVIVALLLDAKVGWHAADPILGLAIAAWLLWGAWRASAHAVNQLMDKEWSEAKRQRFLDVARAEPECEGIHDLRTRTSGGRDFAQFHIWIDPDKTLVEAHAVMDRIEAKLEAAFPGTEILIHPDPRGHYDERHRHLAQRPLHERA